MQSFSKDVWLGESQIILSIDIGTTHSAVSFSYLSTGIVLIKLVLSQPRRTEPEVTPYFTTSHRKIGGSQKLYRVTEWPGQKFLKGESKVPTLVYYDAQHKVWSIHEVVSCGADTLRPEMLDQAEDEGWSLAQFFKLHLHPHSIKAQDNLSLQPLPLGISLAKIYTDFLGYLLQHTQAFFEAHIIEGHSIWQEYSPNMLVVLTHPNGWTIREQHFLRQSLRNVQSNYSSSCRVWFVTEAEASVHFCMFHSDMESYQLPDTDLIVCDAGGSTIDITTYHVEETTPVLKLKERKASGCVQAGGVLVDLECKRYLTKLLANVDLDPEDAKEYINAGVQDFEQTTKKEFNSPEATHYISFRDNKLTVAKMGIRRGRMALEGATIETFFDRCISEIITSAKEQMTGLSPKHFLLVGGLGESLYLRRRLSAALEHQSCQITVIHDSTAKAAADGAVIWATKRAVVRHVARVSYGTESVMRYRPSDPEHQARAYFQTADGRCWITGVWYDMIKAGTELKVQETARRRFYQAYNVNLTGKRTCMFDIWVFYGKQSDLQWIKSKDGDTNPGFQRLCRVEADLSTMQAAMTRMQGEIGPYDKFRFSLVIEFGGTELSARIEWEENGLTKSGPASIIPEPVDLSETNNKS
ncbi:hypothetical protein BDV93DRAFT_544894 [Ceratobasidium sp. AG-I]|nr:hypothetical protein BDV93DRAFT_544894 [Ceratobasidium sp. AG-I]